MKEYDYVLDVIEYEELISKATIPIIKKDITTKDKEFIDTNWVNGVTCSEDFKFLTNFERRILSMSYSKNMTDQEIASEFGFCRATINRRKLAAKAKLEKHFKEKEVV